MVRDCCTERTKKKRAGTELRELAVRNVRVDRERAANNSPNLSAKSRGPETRYQVNASTAVRGQSVMKG